MLISPHLVATLLTAATAIDASMLSDDVGVKGLEDFASPRAANAGLSTALRVAVYDFKLQDVSPKIGNVVSDSMVAEIRKLEAVSAIGMDEIRDMLSHEASKQLVGCEADESCLAEIAGALGVDNLVTGVLSRVGDGHLLVVRRIDQGRAEVVGTVNKRLKAGAGQEFLLAIGPAVEELFAERRLRPGAKRGVPREVALRIDPPPLPTWSFYSVAGGAAAVAAAGGVFGLLARDQAASYRAEARRGTIEAPTPGARLSRIGDSAESRATIANGAFIGAGTLALSAAVMAFFTDWYGYGYGADSD